MKKFITPTNILVYLIIAFFITIASCKKDTTCTVEVLVKSFDDTSKVVPNAWIHIWKGDVGTAGHTNGSGIFSTTFALEAILDIKVEDSTQMILETDPVRIGTGTIRLEAGKTVRTTVLVK